MVVAQSIYPIRNVEILACSGHATHGSSVILCENANFFVIHNDEMRARDEAYELGHWVNPNFRSTKGGSPHRDSPSSVSP